MKSRTSTVELSEAKEQGLSDIGHAAERSGVTAKMIRHYESIGLLPAVQRTASNYRIYSEADIHALTFIRRARKLGFSMKEIETLLGLWRNKRRASAEVKKLALSHIEDLDHKIAEMQAMRRALGQLTAACHGDQRPDCPILDDLDSARPCHAVQG